MSDSDNWWSQPESLADDAGSNLVSTQALDPITAPVDFAPVPPLSAPTTPANPYYIDTIMTGGGGNDPTYETVLVTPNGNIAVTQDQAGQYVANVAGMANGDVTGAGSADTTGAAIDLAALPDLNKTASEKAFGTGFGEPLGYAYEMKNSEGDVYKRFDAQGNLTEYLDQDGIFRKTSDVQPNGTVFNPSTGGFDTLYSVNGSQGVTGEWVPGMSVYHEDQGGFFGEGAGERFAALGLAALSAGVAGGAFAGYGLGSAFASGAAAVNPILTAATQGALIGGAAAGMQGGSYSDMLKSAVIGGVSAGLTPVIGGADLGTLGTAAAKTGLQTGLTAIAGGDVGKAAITGLINGILPVALTEILPADTMSAFNSLPDPVKKIVMSTAGNVLNAGFNGTDISDAATSGVVNGMISLGKDYIKGAFNSLSDSELAQTVKGYFNPSSTAGDFTGSSEDIALYDPNPALDEVINNLPVTPPLVQDTINRNTPVTAETVITPPLIQTAMGQTNPDDVYRELVAGYENPYSASSLGTLASASTSDVNPVVVDERISVDISGANPQAEKLLEIYNQGMREAGFPDASFDDETFLDWMTSVSPSAGVNAPSGLPSGLYSIGTGDVRPIGRATVGDSPLQSPLDIQSVVADMMQKAKFSDVSALLDVSKNPVVADALYSEGMRKGATPEQAQALVDAFLNDPNSVNAIRQEVMRIMPVEVVESIQPVPPPLVQEAINQNIEQVEPEKVEPQKVQPENANKKDTKAGGSGTQGGSLAGDQGRVGAAAPLATSTPSESAYGATEEFQALETTQATAVESQSISVEMANLGMIDPADIPVVTANLNQSSKILNVTPSVAVTDGFVTNQGTLSDKGIEKVSSDTGLSTAEVANAVQGSSTIETSTGSGLKSYGTGAAKGSDTGVSGDEGLGGRSGTGVGGQGTGVGTGVGAGEGTGSGGGLPSSGGSYGGARLTINPQFPGALPGSLEGTYLKGVDVDAYDPFENYNTYQQIAPINAAQGGSPLQLMQLQQGIVGGDPRQYSMVQPRQAPNYFTYGADTSSNTPTTFAGSQLMGKPRPSIPVTPTGNIGANDWMYGAAGSNQLSPAGASIPALPSGMMAAGGMAHGGLDEGEHIPEFITGATGNYVKGRGTGQSDEIPAMLADGEWVADADVVAALGDGSSDAGAELLDAFRHVIRDHKRSAPSDKIPPAASPLAYMKEALQRTGRLK